MQQGKMHDANNERVYPYEVFERTNTRELQPHHHRPPTSRRAVKQLLIKSQPHGGNDFRAYLPSNRFRCSFSANLTLQHPHWTPQKRFGYIFARL